MSFRAKVDFGKNGPLSLIVGLIILLLLVYAFIKITQWVFKLLYIASPFLLIATLIMDPRVVKDYILYLSNLTKRNAPLGIGAIVLSVVFFPIPITWLFFKALMRRQVKKHVEAQRRIEEGDLVDFEELESRPLEKREIRSGHDNDIV